MKRSREEIMHALSFALALLVGIELQVEPLPGAQDRAAEQAPNFKGPVYGNRYFWLDSLGCVTEVIPGHTEVMSRSLRPCVHVSRHPVFRRAAMSRTVRAGRIIETPPR